MAITRKSPSCPNTVLQSFFSLLMVVGEIRSCSGGSLSWAQAASGRNTISSTNSHGARQRSSADVSILGQTPPMGWNSWNRYGCNINEALIRKTADALVSTGLAALGYRHVNIDDCWAAKDRDAQGRLKANPVSFPSGIKALAAYVHSKGLKLGIYADAGTATCSGLSPGSLGHEMVDAKTFASWKVDYLKYDNCHSNDGIHPVKRFSAMATALKAVNRPIFYSICNWGQYNPASWAPYLGQSWRTTPDIKDKWITMRAIAVSNNQFARYAGPGRWNDPDMLEVGNGGMTTGEYRLHFSLWAIMKAPLLIGCDVTRMTGNTVSILSNHEVIAVNQDPIGRQGKRIFIGAGHEIWAGPLTGNRTVVALVNIGKKRRSITVQWRQLAIPASKSMTVRDLWRKQDFARTFSGKFSMQVASHEAALLVLR